MTTNKQGIELLQSPSLNRSRAFTVLLEGGPFLVQPVFSTRRMWERDRSELSFVGLEPRSSSREHKEIIK